VDGTMALARQQHHQWRKHMGLLSGLLGNASTIDPAQLADELEPILAAEETIEVAFKVIRDQFIVTNARLLLIDKQGLTGKKVEYLSIP
jgi:hypothetical protein